jgi:hypothetical protein
MDRQKRETERARDQDNFGGLIHLVCSRFHIRPAAGPGLLLLNRLRSSSVNGRTFEMRPSGRRVTWTFAIDLQRGIERPQALARVREFIGSVVDCSRSASSASRS